MSTLTELGDYLEAQAVGTVGTNLFLGQLPETPDTAMALVPYPGRQPEQHLKGDATIQIEFPRFQFLSRAVALSTALANAETAYRLLAKVANQTLGSTFYSAVTVLTTPGIFRWDEQGDRPIVLFNFECEKALS